MAERLLDVSDVGAVLESDKAESLDRFAVMFSGLALWLSSVAAQVAGAAFHSSVAFREALAAVRRQCDFAQ